MQYLLMQYKIVSEKKDKDVENRIETPTRSVAKCLQRNELSEWRIEEVYERNDHLFWHNPQIPGAKLI
jgi:hypothetical protein